MMSEIWIVDGHCDSLLDYCSGQRSLRADDGGQWDLRRARQGKLGLQFMAAYIASEYKPERSLTRGLQLLQAAQRFLLDNSEEVFLIRTEEDLNQLPRSGKLGLLLSVEGGEILGDSLFMLDVIHHLGVRALGLTWNQRNAIGDGAGETNSRSRLTHFGEAVVRRMNELGMLVDVSHLNETGFWHVLEISTQSIVASHSCAAALCPHPRNLSDAQLKGLAENGGLIGINFYPNFLKPSGQARREDVVRHITHIADVAGVDAVGMGSDFDGISEAPEGLESVEKMELLLDDLRLVGFNENEIRKICYGNFMRLLANVIK